MEDQVLRFGGGLLLKMKVAKLRGTLRARSVCFGRSTFWNTTCQFFVIDQDYVSVLREMLYRYCQPDGSFVSDNYECFLTMLTFRSYGCQLVFYEKKCCEKRAPHRLKQ